MHKKHKFGLLNKLKKYTFGPPWHTLSKLGSNTSGGFQEKWFVGSFTIILKI